LIEECHRNNIRVATYISNANMFYKDMFQAEPESQRW